MSSAGHKSIIRAFAAASAVAFAATGVLAGSPDASTPELLVSEPPVKGFINDGDESIVQTVYLYLDGCPLVSITPPANGKGDPVVTMIEPDGECATSVGLADKASLVVSDELRESGGMHVQLWQDDLSDLDPVEDSPGKSLIVEISNLFPPDGLPGGEGDPVFALGAAPSFWIPGVFGDPSGNLLVGVSNPNGNGGTPLFGSGPGTNLGFLGGGGGGGGNGSGGGSGSGPGGGSSTPSGGIFPGGGGGIPGLPTAGLPPDVAPVPLPATLLLLLWALTMMRSYVRRR